MYIINIKTIEQRLRRTLNRYGYTLHKTRKVLPEESRDYCYWIENRNDYGTRYNDEIQPLTLDQVIEEAERVKEKNL